MKIGVLLLSLSRVLKNLPCYTKTKYLLKYFLENVYNGDTRKKLR